jgi:hypothetical protein
MALVTNNVMIYAQMAHDQWLGKCVVLLHMLKPLHQNALYHSSSQVLAMKKIPNSLKMVLDEVVNVVNSVNSRLLNTRIFSAIKFSFIF